MIQIETIKLGLPQQDGTQLLVIPKINNTQDKTCSLDWRITTDDGKDLATGNILLSEEQYAGWGTENEYLENIVLETLKLNRI